MELEPLRHARHLINAASELRTLALTTTAIGGQRTNVCSRGKANSLPASSTILIWNGEGDQIRRSRRTVETAGSVASCKSD